MRKFWGNRFKPLLRGDIKSKVIRKFMLIALVFGVLGIVNLFNVNTMFQQFTIVVERDAIIIENAREMAKLLVDMETGQRGFIITGKEEFLEPYNNGIVEFEKLMQEEMGLVNDNPSQVEQLQSIQLLVSEWQEKAAHPEIDLARLVHAPVQLDRDSKTFEDLSVMLQGAVGKNILDRLRDEFQIFTAVEHTNMEQRFERASNIALFSILFTILMIVLGISLAIYVGFKLANTIATPIGSLKEWAKTITSGNLKAEINITEGIGEIVELGVALTGLQKSLQEIAVVVIAASEGNYEKSIVIRSEGDRLAKAINSMLSSTRNQLWIAKSIRVTTKPLKGDADNQSIAENVIKELVVCLGAKVGTFYILDDNENVLEFIAGYGVKRKGSTNYNIELGEGVAGKAAKKGGMILLSEIPKDYFKTNPLLSDTSLNSILTVPLVANYQLEGLIEIGKVDSFSEIEMSLMKKLTESIAIGIRTSKSRVRINQLLQDSQLKNKKLEAHDTVLRGKQEELERAQLEMVQRIEALNEAAIVSETDPEGVITFVNEAFCKISGYSREELIGQNHRMLKSGKQPDELFVGMWKDINMGQVWNGEVLNKKKGGKDFYWADTTIMPFKNTEGDIVKYVAVRFDITDRKHQQTSLELKAIELEVSEQELQKSLEKEKELGRLKSKFVATASHQFRTPLTIIQSSMGILSMQTDSMGDAFRPKFEKIYGRIKGQINNMASLMSDVLILGKINSGSIQAVLKPTDLTEICQVVITNYNEIQTDGRKMEFGVNGVSDMMNLDFKLMEHALSNLVSNAFKYSAGKPAPKLTINYNEKEVQVAVKDSGVGIPSEDIEHLFEPFYRASNVDEVTGTGLGTSIAKDYIELNNGSLMVISKIGEGSEFIAEFKK